MLNLVMDGLKGVGLAAFAFITLAALHLAIDHYRGPRP